MQSWLLKPPDLGKSPRLEAKRGSIRCSSLVVGQKDCGHHLNFDLKLTFRDEIVLAPEIERRE
jgi:hypothetical protein